MPYILRKTKTGYKVCLKSDPSRCFSKEGLPKARAKAQMKAIAISEHKQGGRLTIAQSAARDKAREEANAKAKAAAYHTTGIQSSIAKKTGLKRRTDIMKGQLGDQLNSYKRVLSDVATQLGDVSADKITKEYQEDIKKIQNYDFYGIRNNELRDQIDKQYVKMWNNMKNRPRVYGMLPENAKGEYGTNTDPRYIRYVYEHYGQGERTIIDDMASGLEGIVSLALTKIPLVGDMFDAGMEAVHSQIDKVDEPKAGEEAGDVDYDLLDTGYEDRMAKAAEQRAILEGRQSELTGEQSRLQSQLSNLELVDTELTPEEIEYQAKVIRGGARAPVTPQTKSIAFMNQLEDINLKPDDYMQMAKYLATKRGYDPSKLSFAIDGEHKLAYDSPEGMRKFGRVGYGDFIIWTWLEKSGKVPKGTAAKKQQVFHKSHGGMSKRFALKKYDPNVLALNINW